MKLYLSIALLFVLNLATAQIPMQPYGHLTIFSEDGDKFYLILNGERINDVPQTNLRVEELVQPYYNAKIIFEDNTKQEITKNALQIADVDGIFMDVTYKIKRDKNNSKKMKLNYFSMIPVAPDFIPPSNVKVIRYGTPAPPPPVTGGVTQTTTTTTTTNGVNAGINMGGVGVSININDPGMSVTHSQTTTTTTTSGGTYVEPVAEGCVNGRAMAQNNFNGALNSVKNQNFDDTRLKTAKQIVSANCLTAAQIAQMCKVFGFEQSKLDFAKFAFPYCTDPNNYYKVNDVFEFSTSVDELSDYVSGGR